MREETLEWTGRKTEGGIGGGSTCVSGGPFSDLVPWGEGGPKEFFPHSTVSDTYMEANPKRIMATRNWTLTHVAPSQV